MTSPLQLKYKIYYEKIVSHKLNTDMNEAWKSWSWNNVLNDFMSNVWQKIVTDEWLTEHWDWQEIYWQDTVTDCDWLTGNCDWWMTDRTLGLTGNRLTEHWDWLRLIDRKLWLMNDWQIIVTDLAYKNMGNDANYLDL